MKKYELIKSNISGFFRIKALRDFGNVKKGDVGGYVEKEANLSHKGNCWVYDNAEVYGDAKVYDNATIYNNAEVFGNARVFGNAKVCGYAEISNDAKVFGDAEVYNYAEVNNDAKIFGNAKVYSYAKVYGDAVINENKHIGIITEKFKSILYIQCEKRLITIYKDMNDIIRCNIDCQKRMTLGSLMLRIKNDGGMKPHREQYVRIMENAHLLLK